MTPETQKARPPVRSRTHTDVQPKAPPKHTTIEAALAEALAAHGVMLAPRASGRFERFDAPDKPKGNGNGWYRIHTPQAASFGIWHLDVSEVVTLHGGSDSEAAAQARLDAMRDRERLERDRQQQAAKAAERPGAGGPRPAPAILPTPGWPPSGYRPTTCASAAMCCWCRCISRASWSTWSASFLTAASAP